MMAPARQVRPQAPEPHHQQEVIDAPADEPGDRADTAREVEPGARDLARQLEQSRREAQQLESDLRNYRRHAEAKLARCRQETTHEVLAEVGDVLAQLEQALEAADGDASGVRDGVALVVRGLCSLLERHGLQRIPTEGHRFDPQLHEALLVEQQQAAPKGTVVRELAPGFRTDERVVKPAKVAVAA